MFTRDVERLARSLVAQRLDVEYIRHYLGETYQLDAKTIDQVFVRIGLSTGKDAKGKPLAKGAPDPGADRRNRQGFT